jgi:hypothetical protein
MWLRDYSLHKLLNSNIIVQCAHMLMVLHIIILLILGRIIVTTLMHCDVFPSFICSHTCIVIHNLYV